MRARTTAAETKPTTVVKVANATGRAGERCVIRDAHQREGEDRGQRCRQLGHGQRAPGIPRARRKLVPGQEQRDREQEARERHNEVRRAQAAQIDMHRGQD